MSTNKARITLKDIAQQCGYSVNTVSRALRPDSGLPEETVNKIRTTAYEIGYIRNNLASSLRSGKTNIVAIIIEELQNQHYSYLLNELSRHLNRNGYQVMILADPASHRNPVLHEENLIRIVSYAVSHSVDGVLFFPSLGSCSSARILQQNHIPLVLVDREIEGFQADVVRVDDYQGGRLAAEILLKNGHRQLLYLAGPTTNGSQVLREKGFLDVLRENRMDADQLMIISHETIMSSVEDNTLDELLFPVEYTGIFSFNDQIAYYVMNCLRENGIQVPQDVSIVGFDHIKNRFTYLMPLSSIAETCESDMPGEAVRLLVERIENPGISPRSVILPVEYFEDGTLAPVDQSI